MSTARPRCIQCGKPLRTYTHSVTAPDALPIGSVVQKGAKFEGRETRLIGRIVSRRQGFRQNWYLGVHFGGYGLNGRSTFCTGDCAIAWAHTRAKSPPWEWPFEPKEED